MITIKTIVQKITSNKMILFGILGAYFGIPGVGLVITSILDKDMGLLAPGVFFLLPALVLWFFFFKAAQTRRDIKRNGEIQRLAKAGFGTPDEICAKIDAELSNSLHFSHSYKGGLFITQNWIITRIGMSVFIRPTKELIWAYKKETRTNYAGVYFSVVLVFSDGKVLEVRTESELKSEEILLVIYEKLGHVLIGYKEVYQQLFKSNISQLIALGVQRSEQGSNQESQQ